MPPGYVYLIEHKASGKVYVGQTWRSVEERFVEHQRPNDSIRLYRAFAKYGSAAFTVTTLLSSASDQHTLDAMETFWGNLYRARDRKYGYNIKPFGSHGRHSTETRIKMSISARNRSPPSLETCARISAAKMGHATSEEARAKMSAARKARPPASLETRIKMSKAAKKRPPASLELRAKRAAAARGNKFGLGRVCSAATRAKMSASAKRQPSKSLETRARMSAAQKKRWASIS